MIRQIARLFPSGSVLGGLAAALFCGPLCGLTLRAADEPQKDNEQEAQREQQLKNMQRSAAQYALSSADTPKRVFKFHETPVIRPSNPITGTKDGALYVWTDHGRPQALLKFFTFNNKTYSHAWLSLSENKFVAERNGKVIWSPAEPGIKWREIAGAPQPAETAAKRLRQMKTEAAKFTATYTAVHLGAKPFELRILPQPLLRYETDDDYRADGALFGYVQSTTPVGLLLLESRQTEGGHRWHYAYSSLVTGPVTARYGDQDIFSLERDSASTDPKQPFVLFRSLPVPKE
jgi:hypothetical protein